MAKRRPKSYFWAHPKYRKYLDESRLSAAGRVGLKFGEELARDAIERRDWALETRKPLKDDWPRTTAKDLVAGSARGFSPPEVYRYIGIARAELFPRQKGRGGPVTDRSIFRQLKTAKERHERRAKLIQPPPRICAAPGCANVLLPDAPATRDWCSSRCYMRLYRTRGAVRKVRQ
jgi:hypothetical protein